jgi:hypothetical protein
MYLFTREAFKCDCFYSKNQIYKDIPKNLWRIIIIDLILVVVFTIILNSYWPILLSIFDTLKKFLQQGKKGFNSSISFIQFQTSQSSNQEEKQISDDVVKQMEEK